MSSAASENLGNANAPPKVAAPVSDGPGLVGLKLSWIKERQRDLRDDVAFPKEQRDQLSLFYSRELNKLQLQLEVLGKTEEIHAAESTLQELSKALDRARSEKRRKHTGEDRQADANENATRATSDRSGSSIADPEDEVIREAEKLESLTEAALIKSRAELHMASSRLESFCQDDAKWDEQKTSAARWELSRKWATITPDELKPAVESIRHKVEHSGCWQCMESTKKLCYAALHPVSPNCTSLGQPENLEPYKRFLTVFLTTNVEKLLVDANHPAPVIFKCYIDVLEGALKVTFRAGFKQLLDLAKVWPHVLGMHPIEWAKRQVEILIAEQKSGIRLWIKEVCDPWNPKVTSEKDEDLFFWGTWRAPHLIHMRPAGNTPYEQATTWNRAGLVKSEELVEGRAEFLAECLRIDIDQVVREAYVEFAKEGKIGAWRPSQNERQQRETPANTPPAARAQLPDVWRSLHDTFKAMSEEELRLAPHNTGDRWLRGYVDYKDQTVPCGSWYLSQGVNESFRERFEVEATRAGIALGSTLRGEACDLWLHHVFFDLLEHKSKLLFAAGKGGGIIVRACEASQVYCARLEKLALLEGKKVSVGVRGRRVKLNAPGSASEEPDPLVGAALLEAVVMKVKNPQRYTFLTTSEAALYFRVTIRTIWRWNAEDKLRSGGRRGTITIESILRWEKKRSRKHARL